MDLLLAHAYYLSEDPVEAPIMRPYAPLGLLYNSAYLKSKGFSVGVFDSTFRAPEDFRTVLNVHRPAVVGLYVNMMTRSNALAMIAIARAQGAHVVLGGPEPPAHAEELLAEGADVIAVGEGELTLEELLPALQAPRKQSLRDIPGLIFRGEDGVLVHTAPRSKIRSLDDLPFPDREAIRIEEYQAAWRAHHGKSSVSLITARGCPFKCAWCSHAVYGHTHRRRSPSRVVDEIEIIRSRYAPEMLWFADDVFTINPKWTYQWAQEMRSRGIRIPFECISRADCLSEDVIKMLAETGCYRVWFGSESGSQRILDAMDRGVTVEEIRHATRALQRHGIEAGLFVMLGYMDETEEDIEATLSHLKATRADTYLITVAYPIKGTTFQKRLGDRWRPAPHWRSTTDRDGRFAGRPSDRYYRFAVTHVNEEMNLHSILTTGSLAPLRALRSLVRSRVARLGMRVTRNLGSL